MSGRAADDRKATRTGRRCDRHPYARPLRRREGRDADAARRGGAPVRQSAVRGPHGSLLHPGLQSEGATYRPGAEQAALRPLPRPPRPHHDVGHGRPRGAERRRRLPDGSLLQPPAHSGCGAGTASATDRDHRPAVVRAPRRRGTHRRGVLACRGPRRRPRPGGAQGGRDRAEARRSPRPSGGRRLLEGARRDDASRCDSARR